MEPAGEENLLLLLRSESIPPLQALQEVLAGLSGEDIETLQESVFNAPEIPESLHEQLIHHETS
ncbi:hypothetical protein MYX82_13945 [Acidobacteria bacterium AH-259-D05]|nr:hypothetical protein [Acidobacteria bacterium AH-259-D05]